MVAVVAVVEVVYHPGLHQLLMETNCNYWCWWRWWRLSHANKVNNGSDSSFGGTGGGGGGGGSRSGGLVDLHGGFNQVVVVEEQVEHQGSFWQ